MGYFIEDNGRLISKIAAIISMVLIIANWVIILVGMYKENGSIFFDGAFDCFADKAYTGVCFIIAIVFMGISLLLFCLSYIFNAMGAKKVCAIIFSIFATISCISLLLGMLSNSDSFFLAFIGDLSQIVAFFATAVGGIGLFIMGMIDSDHRGTCLILYADIVAVAIGWMIAIGIVILLGVVITFIIGGFLIGGGSNGKDYIVDGITGEIKGVIDRN